MNENEINMNILDDSAYILADHGYGNSLKIKQ